MTPLVPLADRGPSRPPTIRLAHTDPVPRKNKSFVAEVEGPRTYRGACDFHEAIPRDWWESTVYHNGIDARSLPGARGVLSTLRRSIYRQYAWCRLLL